MNLYIDITDKKKVKDVIDLFRYNQIEVSEICENVDEHISSGLCIDRRLTFLLRSKRTEKSLLCFPEKGIIIDYHKANLVSLSVMVKVALKY